jgi:hypothetical protein
MELIVATNVDAPAVVAWTQEVRAHRRWPQLRFERNFGQVYALGADLDPNVAIVRREARATARIFAHAYDHDRSGCRRLSVRAGVWCVAFSVCRRLGRRLHLRRKRSRRSRFGWRQDAVVACKPLARCGDLRTGRSVLSCSYAVPHGGNTENCDQPGQCNEAFDHVRRLAVGTLIAVEIATAALASQPKPRSDRRRSCEREAS